MRDLEAVSRQRVKRRNIFVRILAALSRVANAVKSGRVLRRLRPFDQPEITGMRRPASCPTPHQTEENCRNGPRN